MKRKAGGRSKPTDQSVSPEKSPERDEVKIASPRVGGAKGKEEGSSEP